MKTQWNIVGLFLLFFILSGCSTKNKPISFDYGHVENNQYLNSFFGLAMNLPVDWIVQTKEQTENLSEKGKELIAGDDNNMKAVLNAAEINSATLLSVFQYEVGSAVQYNPNIVLVAENLKAMPGVKNGSDYLFQSRKLLKQSQLQYSYIDEEFQKISIDKQEFFMMNASIDYMGLTIKQVYYATIMDGFCLGAIISFNSDEQRLELEKIIGSMKFHK